MKTPLFKTITASAFAASLLSFGPFAPTAAHAGGDPIPSQTCASTQGFVMGGNGNLQIIVSPGDRFDVVSASSGSILGYATHYIWSGDVFLKKGKFQPSSS